MTWILAVVPLALLILGFPVFLIFLVSGFAVVFALDMPLTTLHTVLFGGVDHFPLLAVPFFIFAGEIIGQGGIARRLIDWTMSILGGVRGNLAYTTIGTAEVFGSMSGSSAGAVAAIGRVLYPALREQGYPMSFASGLITSSGAIAIIIPPSITMILYGVQAQASVVSLFTAGIIPGILIGTASCLYIAVYARSHSMVRGERFRAANVWRSTKEAGWALGTPVIVLGGIYGGVFTPTEAAGVACVYAVFVTRFVYREVTWRQLWRITEHSVYVTAQILVIVAAAGVYSWLLTTSGVPSSIVGWIDNLDFESWAILLAINILLLIVGCFIDPASAVIILTPLLVPVVTASGIDLIHFGIAMTVSLSIGMYTPPFGLNIFVTQALFDVPLATLYRGLVPFIVINIACLLLITYVPVLSIGLVHVFQ